MTLPLKNIFPSVVTEKAYLSDKFLVTPQCNHTCVHAFYIYLKGQLEHRVQLNGDCVTQIINNAIAFRKVGCDVQISHLHNNNCIVCAARDGSF